MFCKTVSMARLAGACLLLMASCSAPCPAAPPNILLLCIDDLRPELACYGVDYIQSPNIDALARQSRIFRRHFVQAPTCGASRYALLTGCYGGASNDALFQRARKMRDADSQVTPSLPATFRQHGYRTVSVGKVSHHPGGRGGPNWDDASQPEMPAAWDRHLLPAGPWQHPRGAMHGLAHGEIRGAAKSMDLFQAAVGDDSIYPDGLIVEESLRQLESLAAEPEQPFFLAVGLIRPHLPFGAPRKYLELYEDVELPATQHPEKPAFRTTWHGSGEFMKYNRWGRDPRQDAEFALQVRRHYAACVSYADAQVGKLLERLRTLQLDENTIVVLWGDHGWHLGEHAIWGKHSLFEESLHSPLLIRSPGLPQPGADSHAIVQSIDVFPTLCELAGLPAVDFVDGVSLVEKLNSPASAGRAAISYTGNAATIRSDTHRLILHSKDGYVELYDERSEHGETLNVAEQHPALVEQLQQQLERALQGT